MRFGRIEDKQGRVSFVIEQDNGRLSRAEGDPFQGGLRATNEALEVRRWLPPVDPRAILCIGKNYAAHAKESGGDIPEYPILFMKNPAAAIGHEEKILIPAVCKDEVDYEGELAVIIGRACRNVRKEDALEYVHAYAVANDVSARIWQAEKGGTQWVRGKSFDTFAPMGPFAVTSDEIRDPAGLTLQTLLNDKEVQKASTSDMIFDVPTLLEFLSQGTTLLPGTVVLTGTPEGVGWARSPRRMLHSNDVVTVTIDRIGTLRNRVA